MSALLLLSSAAMATPAAVSMWDDWFYDDAVGSVWVRIHYPAEHSGYGADPVGGDYPVIVFMHGYMGAAWMYTDACSALAELGYVVLNMDTEVGVFVDTDQLAADAQATLHWLDDASNTPSHWLAGMASDDDWIAMGHSFGGIALARLVSMEPRVQTAIGFMPYQPHTDEHGDYEDFTGRALFIAGSEDVTSTPDMVTDWFDSLQATEHGLLYTIEGAGHQAISDFEWQTESMPDVQQREAVLQLTEDFLSRDDAGLLCDLPADMTDTRSASDAPLVWAAPDPTGDGRTVQVGLAEHADREVVLYAGRGPGETLTDVGTIDLRDALVADTVTLSDGTACTAITLDASLEGIGWIQAVFTGSGDAAFSAPIDVFGVGDPGPAEDTGSQPDTPQRDAPADASQPQSDAAATSQISLGCTAAPSPARVFLPLIALLALYRRR